MGGVPAGTAGRIARVLPRGPSASPVPAHARSPIVITTREASATTSADADGMTGASTAISATSRGPMPPGKKMIRNPTAQASAYPPSASANVWTPLSADPPPPPFPAKSLIRNQACAP